MLPSAKWPPNFGPLAIDCQCVTIARGHEAQEIVPELYSLNKFCCKCRKPAKFGEISGCLDMLPARVAQQSPLLLRCERTRRSVNFSALQNIAASAESAAALTQLTQVLEKAIEGALNAVAESFDALTARVLASEQKRIDFQPPDMGAMAHMDTPTPACDAVTALLRSLQTSVEESLPVGASRSFLLEVRPLVA